MAVTGYKLSGTQASADRDAKNAWVNPGNAGAIDNNYAVCDVPNADYGDWLRLTNFGFAVGDIPAGSTIDGIEVEIDRHGSSTQGGAIRDSAIYLRDAGGQTGNNKADVGSDWPTNDAVATYGGAADMWGTALDDADIRAATFGIDISAQNMHPVQNRDASVDYVRIRVYYTLPATTTTTLAPTTTSTTTLAPTTTSTSTLAPTTSSTTTLAPTTTSTSTLPPTTTSTSTLPPTTTSTSTLPPTTTSTSTLPPTTTSTSTLPPTTTSTSTLPPTTTSTSTLPPTTSTTTLAPTTSSTTTLAPTTSTSTLSTTTVSTTSTVTVTTTVTTTTLPPVALAPTTPTHEQSLSLTLNVFKPDFSTGVYKPRGIYVTSLQSEVNSYSHEIKAFGGYWSSKFTILDKQEDMEGWLTDGLGRHIEVYDNALVKIWEGFVNQVDLTLGGLTATRGPLLDVANRVRVVYSGSNTETDPSVAGNRVMTAAVNDLESQAEYGIIEQILSAGGMTFTDAEQARDSYMAENALPKTIQKLGSGGGLNVSVSCLGYVHWFSYLISLVGVDGTINLDTKLGRVIDADPNGLFASSNSSLMPNLLQVPAYDNKSRTAWDVIKGLVALGDEADKRYTFGVYADRHTSYQPTNQDEIAYKYFPGDPARRIESSTGGNVWPWNVLPGGWMFFPSFLIGRTFPDDWRQDPRFMFIESVSFSLPHALRLQGGRLDTIPQKLAKMGLAGIGA